MFKEEFPLVGFLDIMKRNRKGQFVKGETNPHKGDHAWVNSGTFKAGHTFSSDTVEKIRKSMKKIGGRYDVLKKHIEINGPWNKGKKTGPLPKQQRKKISKALRGSKSHLWRGGIYSENLLQRARVEYKMWREGVFKRDGWRCQECGKKGCRLNAHHIKPFSLYPELRFAIDNGITLCVSCHKKTDTYLKKLNIKRRNKK